MTSAEDTERILAHLRRNQHSTIREIMAATGLGSQHISACLDGAVMAGRAAKDREHAAAPWRWRAIAPRRMRAIADIPPVTPDVLRAHYLAGVICDGGRENPLCACGQVPLGWHPSGGAAVEAWVDHVMEQARRTAWRRSLRSGTGGGGE